VPGSGEAVIYLSLTHTHTHTHTHTVQGDLLKAVCNRWLILAQSYYLQPARVTLKQLLYTHTHTSPCERRVCNSLASMTSEALTTWHPPVSLSLSPSLHLSLHFITLSL